MQMKKITEEMMINKYKIDTMKQVRERILIGELLKYLKGSKKGQRLIIEIPGLNILGEKNKFKSWRDSTVGTILALHTNGPSLIPGTSHDSSIPSRVIQKHRARSKP